MFNFVSQAFYEDSYVVIMLTKWENYTIIT